MTPELDEQEAERGRAVAEHIRDLADTIDSGLIVVTAWMGSSGRECPQPLYAPPAEWGWASTTPRGVVYNSLTLVVEAEKHAALRKAARAIVAEAGAWGGPDRLADPLRDALAAFDTEEPAT